MRVYRQSDGSISTVVNKDAEPVTFSEVIAYVEKASSWDAVESNVYVALCEELGLRYGDYDDPDELWEDVKKAASGVK